jgi:hypothetical protein
MGSGAMAAPRLVQQNVARSSAGPLVVGFPGNSTSGNTIVALISTTDNTCPLTDIAGNSYTVVSQNTGTGTLTGVQAIVQYARVMTTSVTPVAVTATCTNAELRILEYAGIDFAGASPFDVAATTAGGVSGSVSVGPLATTKTNDLMIAWFLSSGRVLAPDPTYTLVSDIFGDLVEDRFYPTLGSYTSKATVPAGNWMGLITAFHVDLSIDAGTEDAGAPVIGPGIQFVQGNAANAPATTLRVPLLEPSISGDTAIACLYTFSTTCTLTDTANDVYTPVGATIVGAGPYAGAYMMMQIATIADAGTSTLELQVQCASGAGVFLSEYSGLVSQPFLSNTGASFAKDAGIGSAPLSSDAGSTLFLACVMNQGSLQQIAPQFTPRVTFNEDGFSEAIVEGATSLAFNARSTTTGWLFDYAAFAGVAPPDAGVPDAGMPDAGMLDAGMPDAGMLDAGMPDAGTADAGTVDAGTSDGGTSDGGAPDGGQVLTRGLDNVGCGCTASGGPWLGLLLLLALRAPRRFRRTVQG